MSQLLTYKKHTCVKQSSDHLENLTRNIWD